MSQMTTTLYNTINPIDMGVFGLMLLSTLIGVLRGFTREFLGIIAWVFAVLITLWALPFLKPVAQEWMNNKLMADVLTGLFLFVLSLSGGMALTRVLSGSIKKSILGGLDRALGAVFGIGRGALIGLGLFMVTQIVWKKNDRPLLLTTARVYPFCLDGVRFLSQILPTGMIPPALYQNGTDGPTVPLSPETLMYRLAKPKIAQNTPQNQTKEEGERQGYGAHERRHLERLFQQSMNDPSAPSDNLTPTQ